MGKASTRILFLMVMVGVLALSHVVEPVMLGFHAERARWRAAEPLPARPPPRDQAEADLQDLEDLKLLPGLDRSFSPVAKADFERGVAALSNDAGHMSPPEFEMAVSRLVALAGNAHTTVDLGQRAARSGRVPLRFAWFADGLYVVRAAAPALHLLGGQILAIDGRPVDAALAATRPYISGTAERARAESPPLLESPELLSVIWPDTDGVHLHLRIKMPDGDQAEYDVAASPPIADALAARPILAIAPPADGEADWKSVLASAPETPLSLRTPERVAYAESLENDGIYLRNNANGNDAHGPLTRQLETVMANAPPGGWRWIVLDLRFNDGGDELKTAALARALPKKLRSDGVLWILTGPSTFSAAIITAARAKYFAGTRAHIIGEKIGDRAQFWTDGGPQLVLRNSGIAIGHALFKHDWANGCHSIRYCYPYGFIYGVAAGDLSPETTVGWSYADYVAGRDTVMERVRQLELAR